MQALNAGSLIARVATSAALVASAAFYVRLPFSSDHGLYSYGAWRVSQGDVPYRDVGCYDAPGIYAVHGLAHGIFGWSESALRQLDVLWMAGALALLFAIARRIGGRLAGWLGITIAAFVYLGLGYRETAQRDSFTVLFLLATVLIALRPSSFLSTVVLGGCSAAVFWLKPPMILISAPALLLRVWPVPPLGWGGSAKHAGGLALGFAAVSLPIGVYLAWTGTTEPFIECFVDYTRLYASVRYPLAQQLAILLRSVLLTPIAGLALLAFVWLARERGVWLVALCTLGALVSVVVQGKQLTSHLVPLWMLLSLGAALAMARGFTSGVSSTGKRGIAAPVVAGVALALVALQVVELHSKAGHPQLIASAWKTGSLRIEREDAKVARYLRAHTQPDDRIVVWGVGSGAVYFLAQRAAPTRFLQTYAFTSPFRDAPLIQRWRLEYLAALERTPPRYFVVMGNDAFPGVWNIDSERGLHEWPALQGWLDANYVTEAQMAGRYRWTIKRLASAAPLDAAAPGEVH